MDGSPTIERSVRIPAGEAAAYGPVGRSPWLDVDWREHQRWVNVGGVLVNTIDLGPERPADAQPLVFVHGLSGCWCNWLGSSRCSPRAPRRDARPAGFRLAVPSEQITMPGYARGCRRAAGELDDAAALVGNLMGHLGPELAIAFPSGSSACSISAAGISTSPLAGVNPRLADVNRCPLAARRAHAGASAVDASRSRQSRAGGGCARRRSGSSCATPVAACAAGSGAARSGKPGFMRAFDAIITTTSARACRRSRARR